MMTRCLALNWGPLGIRVNGLKWAHSNILILLIFAHFLSPGQIDTPIWYESTTMTPKQIEEMWRAVDAKYPVRRRGYPEDIAKSIVFLASKESGFITGVNIRIDGGFLDSQALVFDWKMQKMQKSWIHFSLNNEILYEVTKYCEMCFFLIQLIIINENFL